MNDQSVPRQKKFEFKSSDAAWIKALVENSPSGIYAINDQQQIIFINPKMTEILGYAEEDILGQNFQVVLSEESKAVVTARYRDRQNGIEVPSTYQFWAKCKDGQEKLVEVSGNIITDESGRLVTIGIMTDETWRSEAEEQLRRYEQILSATNDKMSYLDRNYVYQAVNKAYLKAHQKEYNEIVGHSVAELLGEEVFQNHVKEKLDRCLAGELIRYEDWFDFPLKGKCFMEVQYQPHTDDEGNVLGVIVSSHDMTEREQSRQMLRESEEKFRVAFKASPDVLTLNRLNDGVYVDINESFTQVLGYERDEVIGLSSLKLNIWKNEEDRARLVRELQKNGRMTNLDAEFVAKDGSIIFGLMSARIIEIDGEKMNLAISRDITERKKVEEGMARLSFAINHIDEAVYLTDESAEYRYVNDVACQLLGYSADELLGMAIGDVDMNFPKDKWPEFWQQIVKQKSIDIESSHRRKDGSTFPVDMTVNFFEFNGKHYALGMVTDITEKKLMEEERLKFEEQMIQTQKLESLGILAGGVAHDFNNLLAAIMGHSELAKRRLPKESAIIDNLRKIEQAAERAADLAKQMLAYSGRGRFVTSTIDLNLLLEEMLHMLEVSISKNVILRLNPYTPLPAVEVDATQIRQIVMNLVINSSEAIGDKSGVISITTGCMDCDQSYLKNIWLDENLKDGLYVYLEVADSGCGMDRETLSKIFDPFFTTKFTGRGLGMSAVMGIVRGHKGAIKVYSECGKGTTFKILLPASEHPAELFNNVKHDDPWRGHGTVLLVDDEETVRGIGVEMLKEIGFTPITANNGLEALEKFKENPEIDLVILDLTMPKMDGEQCYRELRALSQDLKIVMSSGYNEQEVSQKFVGKGISGFVQKPYKLSVLRDVIRNSWPDITSDDE